MGNLDAAYDGHFPWDHGDFVNLIIQYGSENLNRHDQLAPQSDRQCLLDIGGNYAFSA